MTDEGLANCVRKWCAQKNAGLYQKAITDKCNMLILTNISRQNICGVYPP
jgi:hypothetical protein